MNCKHVKNRLSAYQDGELSSPQMTEIKEHLQTCERCSRELQELNLTWEALDQVESFDAAPFFLAKVTRRLEAGKKSKQSVAIKPLKWIPAPLFTTATLIFGLLIGIYLGKTMYQQSLMAQQNLVEQEINELFVDEYTGESVADIYVSLISENSQ